MEYWRTRQTWGGFHLNCSDQLSSEYEQLTLISDLGVISLGFHSGGNNHTSYINRENLILRTVNFVLEK